MTWLPRRKQQKAPPWSSQEIAILMDVYPQEGVEGACDALPERSYRAIFAMASRLQIRAPIVAEAPKPALSGHNLELAIALREQQHLSFATIGKRFGVCEASAASAVMMEIGKRKGFLPAERDETGRLTETGIARIRAAIDQGLKAIDITLQLGVSQSCVAKQRRDYERDLKRAHRPAPPRPGNGLRYSGARISHDVYEQVDELLMAGHGAPRIADLTGVSKTHVQRRRLKLVRRLARKGECLAGCDSSGKRIAYKDSLASVHAIQKGILRAELLKGTPVSRAAKIAATCAKFAYDLRDELKVELERNGRALPPIRRLGRVKAEAVDRSLSWLPKGKKNLICYRRHLIATAGDQLEPKRRTIKELMPTVVTAPAQPKRRLTFEEQLERVRSGQATISEKLVFRRDPSMTLGGVSAGMLA